MNGVNTASGATLADVSRLLEFESFPIGWVLLLRGWMAVCGTSDAAFRAVVDNYWLDKHASLLFEGFRRRLGRAEG